MLGKKKQTSVKVRHAVKFGIRKKLGTSKACQYKIKTRLQINNQHTFKSLKRLYLQHGYEYGIVQQPISWCCYNVTQGNSWQAAFGRFVSPVFLIAGWNNPSDTSSVVNLYISFDAISNDNGATATWVLYQQDFVPHNMPWPAYLGTIAADDILGCAGVKIVVISASGNNSFSCQVTG